jgi:hypothetical protein
MEGVLDTYGIQEYKRNLEEAGRAALLKSRRQQRQQLVQDAWLEMMSSDRLHARCLRNKLDLPLCGEIHV